MTWLDGSPEIGDVYSRRLAGLLGAPRLPGEPVSQHHMDLAASAQAAYEDAFFHILDQVYASARLDALCLAGGCAFNSLANGRIFERTPFKKVYIQAAAGDAGGALGAAFHVWNQVLKRPRGFVMDHAYWGSSYSEDAFRAEIRRRRGELDAAGCGVDLVPDEKELCDRTARALADGRVVGWFQGRMEWGPRALGNRSILADPRRPDMKDILNVRIKRRESFRPFAPSVLREATGEWFETDADVPFMSQVFRIRKEKRPLIPAVTHVDGTGRLQTVAERQNPLYYRLISAFRDLTGVPLVLNTSFNESEPVVCAPSEALDCFLRTQMDVLVLGSFFISRHA
jgi:carbamoyltransferase